MRIDAYFTLDEVDPSLLGPATVVVMDVIRATTTIAEALASGARAIFPTASTEEAVRLAASLGREDTLLCGERKGAKVEGFDLGNSPREFRPEVVGGKRLVMSTTNGTRALLTGREASRVVSCSFTNLGAVARSVAGSESLVLLCAAREDRFALEDALCAGSLVQRLQGEHGWGAARLNDAALAALTLAGSVAMDRELLARTTGGRALSAIGLGDDLEICAEVDRHDLVPEMRDQVITVSGG